MPSPEHDAVRQMILDGGGLAGPDTPIEEGRAALDGLAAIMPLDPDVEVTELVIPGPDGNAIAAEWLSVPGCNEARAVLYLHGGGYTAGSLQSHRSLSARLARASGSRVLAVDYRLAPEDPHPAAVDDAVAAYRWLLGADAGPRLDAGGVVIAGDSAGGGLTAAALVVLRDAGDPLPAGAVMMSPWTDLTLTSEAMDSRAAHDPICSREALERSAAWYAGEAERTHPIVSPHFADPTGFPPLLILVGTAEILLDDATRLADRARDAGVDVDLDVHDDLLHVWPMFPGVPEADAALARIGDWIAAR